MMMMLTVVMCVVSQFCHYVFNDFSFTRTIILSPQEKKEDCTTNKISKNIGSIETRGEQSSDMRILECSIEST